jgi:TonB family protein
MRNLLMISAFCLLVVTITSGQVVVDTAYFKNEYSNEEVAPGKAKVIQITTKMPDGSLCYKMLDKRSNKVLRQHCYNGDTPCGIWISNGGEKFDYTGKYSYSDTTYTDIPNYTQKIDKLECTIPGNYEPPVFPEYEHNFLKFISHRLIYPQIATENGIQGKVESQFVIDETGHVTNLRIKKGGAKILDVEAARIILQSPVWIPAKLNGKPIRSCITMTLYFVLQG